MFVDPASLYWLPSQKRHGLQGHQAWTALWFSIKNDAAIVRANACGIASRGAEDTTLAAACARSMVISELDASCSTLWILQQLSSMSVYPCTAAVHIRV